MPEDLEPLDSAESLWRAVRKEAGLTRPGRIAAAIVALATGALAIAGAAYEDLAGGRNSDLVTGLVFLAALGSGAVVFLLVVGLDAGFRRVFHLKTPQSAPSADDALVETYELALDDSGWSHAVADRAAALLPTLLAAGYAESDPDGGTWSLTERGLERVEELRRRD